MVNYASELDKSRCILDMAPYKLPLFTALKMPEDPVVMTSAPRGWAWWPVPRIQLITSKPP